MAARPGHRWALDSTWQGPQASSKLSKEGSWPSSNLETPLLGAGFPAWLHQAPLPSGLQPQLGYLTSEMCYQNCSHHQ